MTFLNRWLSSVLRRSDEPQDVVMVDGAVVFPAFTSAPIAEWVKEWYAARKAALDALPPEPEFAIWQSRADGWWRVGQWMVKTVPDHYPTGSLLYPKTPQKPSMEVRAFGYHHAFGPTFKTEAEARKWLKDYLKPPPEKRVLFDADGNEVAGEW